MESVGDWLSTQELRKWRKRRRIAGALNAVLGVSLFTVEILFAPRAKGSLLDVTPTAAIGALQLVAGLTFAFGSRWPRFALWPLSVIYLLAFPVGTLIGSYTIWVLYSTRPIPQPSPDAVA